MTVLTKKQTKTFTTTFVEDKQKYELLAKIRYDDACNNGHNTFSITATLYRIQTNSYKIGEAWGCLHDEIQIHFPNLSKFIKWHLVSPDGPTHYLANALYWAGRPSTEKPTTKHLKSTIVYGAVPSFDDIITPEKLTKEELTKYLTDRLPLLMQSFQKDVESLGFTY